MRKNEAAIEGFKLSYDGDNGLSVKLDKLSNKGIVAISSIFALLIVGGILCRLIKMNGHDRS
jgi:hypothetical protein